MPYLQPTDYSSYNLPPDTPDSLIATASALIEAHCRRPTLFSASYTERVRLIAGSQTFRLSYGPLLPGCLLSGRVRFARPRRDEAFDLLPGHSDIQNGAFLQQIASAFGLPGAWSTLDVTSVDVYPGPGEVTLPVNFLGLGYNEVELTYLAGFAPPPSPTPPQVMAACAQIVRNAQAIPALNVRSSKLDTMQLQYFSGSLIDEGVALMLKPFRSERLG